MNEYEALYRKYRPQTFDEVVGQDTVLSYLKKASLEKKPSHAYLFSGGRGVGKTSLARIFAKSLGVHQEDIYELDAASNRGIDEVRELRDSVHTLPFSSPYKIYILDEAHMLTKDASNALLKTLEEPPSHVIFILATTEKHKLLDTIISRCQVIHFVEPDQMTLAKHLVSIAEKEGYFLEESASLVIAEQGRGSFRDALGILEKVLKTTDGVKIYGQAVRSSLGFSEKEVVEKVVLALFSQDMNALETSFEEARKKTGSVSLLVNDVLTLMRDLLLLRIGSIQSNDRRASYLTQVKEKLQKEVQSKHLLFLLEKEPLLLKASENRRWIILEMIFFEMQSL